MDQKTRYLGYAAAACGGLALFAILIMLVGYQPWDAQHLGTCLTLVVAGVICAVLFFRRKRNLPATHNGAKS